MQTEEREIMHLIFSEAVTKLSGSTLAILLVIGLATSSSAQSPPSTKKPPSPASRVKVANVAVQGQVFVVTKGANNIKLALVEINAFPEKDALSKISEMWRTEVANEELAVQEAEKQLALAREKSSQSKEFMLSSVEDLVTIYSHAEAAKRRLAALFLPSSVVRRLGDPKATTKSDVDGTFELTLPAGTYFLTATSNRLVGGTTEIYDWIVKVDATKPNKKVLLTNDNLADTSVVNSLFSSAQKK